MRVVITQHLRSTPARGAVRIDQRLGIDLEMRFGPGMDIARGQRMRDPPRLAQQQTAGLAGESGARFGQHRSEEHTSELQYLMRISYAVFCLKKKNNESA